ncbi:hypothetical protein PC128_g347 [Phytophthora cactorum]|nr:hypothetical protein PC128_g347 [Phytophthora cactorum]
MVLMQQTAKHKEKPTLTVANANAEDSIRAKASEKS